jgi:hypothetical protein
MSMEYQETNPIRVAPVRGQFRHKDRKVAQRGSGYERGREEGVIELFRRAWGSGYTESTSMELK